MPLSFPSSPTVGQQSTQNGRTYSWTGYAWELVAASGGGALSATVTIPASGDPQWTNTVLLLKGDDLTDSSSYARTVTAYGNATATGVAKFGSASLTFDGSGDYVSVPSSTDFDLGTSYTVECWIRPADNTSNGGIVCRGSYISATASWSGLVFSVRRLGGDGFTRFYFYGTTNANEQFVDVSNSNFPVNTWTHLAMVRSGTTGTIYANGSSVGTISSLNTNAASSDDVSVGLWANTAANEWFNGQIDEVRITRGVARTISVPTATYATGNYTASQTLPVVGTGSIGSGLSWSSVPASATATGTAGQIAYDRQYQYICVATNTWARISLDAFRPTSIAGIQLWLDASDHWTLFNATSGGSNVAADGTVARWEDKSGNARHATESTNGPTRKAAVVGGSDALRFTGAQFLAGATTPASGNVRTFFAVVRKLGTPSDVFFQFGTKPSSGGTLGYIARASLADGNSFIGGDITANNLTIQGEELTFTNAFVSSYVQSSTSSTRYFFNGIEKTVTGSVGSYNMDPGYFVGKCRNVDDLAFFDGYMCELIAYDTALSDANRALVQSYLTAKWGIA